MAVIAMAASNRLMSHLPRSVGVSLVLPPDKDSKQERYSITSSARASSLSGTDRPSTCLRQAMDARQRAYDPRARSHPGHAVPRTRSSSYSLVKQHMFLRSRGAFLRLGFVFLASRTRMRGGGAPRKRSGARAPVARALTRHARRLARRLASLGRRSPLGAPPWRFWAPVPRFRLRHLCRIRAASSSQPGRSARRTGSRGLPVPTVTSRLRRDATPRSIFGIVSGDAPHEPGCAPYISAAFRSQAQNELKRLLH